MKNSMHAEKPMQDSWQGAKPPLSDLEVSNEIEGAVAEIIDAFEQARLVRVNHTEHDIADSMNHIKRSLTLSLRRLAPYAFHAERWLGDEVEQWPRD